MNTNTLKLETIQDTGDDHLTEDAYWVGLYERQTILAIADGAPQRLRPVNSMQPLLDKFAPKYGEGITPSGIASRLFCDTVAELSNVFPRMTLSGMCIEANQRLADELRNVYGELSASAILKHEPQYSILAEDPRYLRLVLPAATYTVVRIDWQSHTFEVAHGADSALIVIQEDGTSIQITPDQMKQHDDAFKKLWLADPDARAEHPFFRDRGDNRGMELNRLNGLYHNFVSSDGQTDTSVGVSVLNGLPEIEDYMFTSTVPLDGIAAFWLMTDGLFWPAPLDESEPDVALRLQSTADHVMNNGLASYVVALREHESYIRESGINPYQWHDDVTSILLRVLN